MERFRRLLALAIVAFVATFPSRSAAQETTALPETTPATEPTSAPADATSAPADTTSAPADATSAPADGSVATPAAADGGPDNTAVAINTKDGADLFRLAFSINRVMSESRDDPDNAAVAYSSCEACETTAIAVQVVIMTTPPDGESPMNLAIAINDQCDSCETVALAYQLVLYTDGPVKLTKEGKEEVKAIVDQLQALEDEDLSAPELDARASALVNDLAVVLNEELEPKHTDQVVDSENEVGDQEQGDSLPSPGMTTSPEDNVNLGEDESSPPPASDAPTTAEPTTDASASPEGSPAASTSEPAPTG